MRNDFRGKAVIVTGGTKGIGLATGLAFGRQGAQLFLTHRWGSADENAIQTRFELEGAAPPKIIEADVQNDDDTLALLETIKRDHDHVEVFVSNVCAVQPTQGPKSYKKRSLHKSIEYSAWPMVAYVQHIDKTFGRPPRYVIGVGSDGPRNYFSHYEYVAISKAVMESFCRYLSYHLRDHDTRINIVSSRNVLTDAVDEIFGEDYVDFMRDNAGEQYFMKPEEIGNAVLAVASGMLDFLNGQVLQVDKGMAFADTLMRRLEEDRKRRAQP
jgi:NAD(P)-dependent dehydrogenase (short-subunit alcohol dehydrogenase family)